MPQPAESSSAIKAQASHDRSPPSGLVRHASTEDLKAELLPKLELEDHVPSVRPWLRISTTAVFASVGLGLLFMAVCPYRVVVRGQGSVRPAGEQVLVNAPFDGRVVSIEVRTNQRIDAGQPIVTLDRARLSGEVDHYDKSRFALDQQLQAMRSQASADYARAELEVEKARSSLAFAQSEFDRYQALVREGAASTSLYEGKRATLSEARATLEQAVAGLKAAESEARTQEAQLSRDIAQVEQASDEMRRNLQKTIVRSPVSGIVFQLLVRNPQQTIASGQELATITPSTVERMVKVSVRSEDVETVRAGQIADLRVAGCPYPDFGTLSARVVSVSPDALPQRSGLEGTQGVQEASNLYEVTLKPRKLYLSTANRRCEVKIGMPLQADIVTREETILRFVLRKTRILVGQ